MNPQNTRYIDEDEIDLRELLRTIIKHKRFVLVFTALVTILAIAYAFQKTPVYEVKSNVRLGYIGDKLLGDPDTVDKELRVVFHVDEKLDKKNEKAFVYNVSVNKKVKNFLEVVSRGITNDEALKKNKEVIRYAQSIFQNRINNYIFNTKNSIEDAQRALKNIDEVEIPDINRAIDKLKTQKIVEINKKISILKNQNIKNLQRAIDKLKTQKTVQIDDKIKFLRNIESMSIEAKIKAYKAKLADYINSVSNLKNNPMKDESKNLIIAIQMVNYQNLILNAENRIQDLKTSKDKIDMETIPNLETEKFNIENTSIKDLKDKIKNIQNVTIPNLEAAKQNIQLDSIKKLEDKINITLRDKKIDLKRRIDNLNYQISSANLKNIEVVGDYVIHDYPARPKKKLIVVVAFVTGLILSVFLVFFMEFIKGLKEEE